MKSFFQIFLLFVLALLVAQALPVIGLPAGFGLGALGVALAVLVACVLGLVAGALGLLAGLLAVVVGVAALLSPIWVPIALLCGLIALFRGDKSAKASGPAVAPAAAAQEPTPTITPTVV